MSLMNYLNVRVHVYIVYYKPRREQAGVLNLLAQVCLKILVFAVAQRKRFNGHRGISKREFDAQRR